MFIIFDLDDTLIDTSAYSTPFKLEKALYRMIEKGLKIEDFSGALEILLRLDKEAESAKAAIEEFIEINGFDPQFAQIALQEIYEVFSEEVPVFPVENALEVLSDISLEHKLAIVSFGLQDHQMWKLKKAGIDCSLFCKILIASERNKKKYYQDLMQEMELSPKDVVVCGDRISTDLLPAKELGCVAVHMSRGRGQGSLQSGREVDYTITHLPQIQKVLFDINSKVSFD